jgi:hypothetical protein
MKTLDILLKDIRRYFRSFFALGMMFLAPLLITALLYFAFGQPNEGGQFNLAPTRVQIINLDRPETEGLAAETCWSSSSGSSHERPGESPGARCRRAGGGGSPEADVAWRSRKLQRAAIRQTRAPSVVSRRR